MTIPRPGSLRRSVVLVGLMGAGKTCVGRRLAKALGAPFVDADDEIEKAAGLPIADIFAQYGEAAFRDCERKVLSRLMKGTPRVIATGGGAFMNPETRARIREHGISVWLQADLDLLVRRTTNSQRGVRPLLAEGDPREILEKLMTERYPTYAEAEIVVDTHDEPPELTVHRVLDALAEHHALTEAAS